MTVIIILMKKRLKIPAYVKKLILKFKNENKPIEIQISK